MKILIFRAAKGLDIENRLQRLIDKKLRNFDETLFTAK